MAIGGYGILFVLMCVGIKSMAALFIPAFFVFAAFGMLTVLTTVFLANTVDYGELKNHRRDESVIFSMQTFVVKLASGVAALAASICLSISHISENTEQAAAAIGSTSVMILRMTMTVLPMLGMLAALIVFKRKFILTEEKVEEIAKQMQKER